MMGSWTSLVSATWAALGDGGVIVGRSRVEARRCITGVFGRVVADSAGRKTFSFLLGRSSGKFGLILGGLVGLVGEVVIATLTRLAMTISTVSSFSGGK